MNNLFRLPYFVLGASLLVMLLAAQVGAFFRERRSSLREDARQDLDLITTATLTLLGFIIGFSFSMAFSRYDQRKNFEEAEANAIGTEYLRADLLPTPEAAQVRVLLREYLHQRILFYETRDENLLQQISSTTSQLQEELWTAAKAPPVAQPTPVQALAVSGMNDVLNSEGHTQAAWWNRIPIGAWGLMASVAIFSNSWLAMVRRPKARFLRLLVLPLVLSIAFFFIADIDSPRRGGHSRARAKPNQPRAIPA
jgi:hypothetical protein